jgi:hypothetical protein
LETFDLSVNAVGDDAYHIRFAVQNTGWMPTYCTKVALQKGRVRGVMAEIELPEGASLQTGKQLVELGQLEGRSGTGTSISPWALFRGGGTSERTFVEWVVKAPQGSEITLIAHHERAGTIRETVTL